MLHDIAYAPNFGYAQLDVSPAGTLVYQRRAGGDQFSVAWLDRSGTKEPLLLKPGRYTGPRLSPDGQRLAIGSADGGVGSLWLYEPVPNRMTRLNTVQYGAPLWTPDGRVLLLGGAGGMAWMPADNSRAPEVLTQSSAPQIPWSLTPDGSRLAYHQMSSTTAFDLWTIPLKRVGDRVTAGTPEAFLRTPSFETYPTFSPDGRWLAYASNDSGAWEVYVRAFPDNGTNVRVSDHGGRISAWSRKQRELFYRTDDHRIMVADYTVTRGAFVATRPRLWTTTDRLLHMVHRWIDLGMPTAASFTLQVYRSARPLTHRENQWVIKRAESQFLWGLDS